MQFLCLRVGELSTTDERDTQRPRATDLRCSDEVSHFVGSHCSKEPKGGDMIPSQTELRLMILYPLAIRRVGGDPDFVRIERSGWN